MNPLYRVVRIDARTSALYGALLGGIWGTLSLPFVFALALIVSRIGDSLGVFLWLIPAGGSIVVGAGIGALIAFGFAQAYNAISPNVGFFQIRLKRS